MEFKVSFDEAEDCNFIPPKFNQYDTLDITSHKEFRVGDTIYIDAWDEGTSDPRTIICFFMNDDIINIGCLDETGKTQYGSVGFYRTHRVWPNT